MLTYKRGNRRIIADYKFDDIYRHYKTQSGKNCLDKKTVRALYKEIFDELIKAIVLDNFQFKMPSNLGYLRVRKKKVEPKLLEDGTIDTRVMSMDWKKTKKLWEKLYPELTAEEISNIPNKPKVIELNEHTDGYRFMWFWEKLTSNIPNQSAYYLEMTKQNKKILSQSSKQNELNFFE